MSSIDLVVLGMVLERPQSAYDIQKDVEYHNLPKWTKVSTPSIYRKVLQLKQEGYLESSLVKGERSADKAIYFITPKGREYFNSLMSRFASQDIPLLFDFNVVITNLNKVSAGDAAMLISKLRESIKSSAQANEENAARYADIPLVGRTIFEQQNLVYDSLLEWLDNFEAQLNNG